MGSVLKFWIDLRDMIQMPKQAANRLTGNFFRWRVADLREAFLDHQMLRLWRVDLSLVDFNARNEFRRSLPDDTTLTGVKFYLLSSKQAPRPFKVGQRSPRHGDHDVIHVDRHNPATAMNPIHQLIEISSMAVKGNDLAVNAARWKMFLPVAAQLGQQECHIPGAIHHFNEEFSDVLKARGRIEAFDVQLDGGIKLSVLLSVGQK